MNSSELVDETGGASGGVTRLLRVHTSRRLPMMLTSCCTCSPIQLRGTACDDSQTLSDPHLSPASQSVSASQDLPAPSDPVFSPFSQLPFLQASPSPHSLSRSQLAPHGFLAPPLPFEQPGNPGGHELGSAH